MGRCRSPLLAGWLTLVTYGVYFPVWLGITWREMRIESKDPGMRPLGHALAIFVPIYGLFRVDDHFRTLNSIAREVGARRLANRGVVVACTAIAWVAISPLNFPFMALLLLAGVNIFVTIWLPFGIAVALCAFIVGYGQSILNQRWRTNASASVVEGMTKIELGVALVGSLTLLWTLLFWSVRFARHA